MKMKQIKDRNDLNMKLQKEKDERIKAEVRRRRHE